MKTWLTKWRISTALDVGKPLAPTVKRAVANSEELRRFAATTAELDTSLKNSLPASEPPASLHAAIMRSVQAAESKPAFSWQALWPRLISAAAIASLVILGILGVSRRFHSTAVVLHPKESPSLATASSALEASSLLVRKVSDTPLSALNEEMLHLHSDLANAHKILLASLP